jgi:hypothetical protein
MIMATSHEQSAATVTPEEALNVLHRKLVSIHYGLAEHGPTDPKLAVPWALAELRGALDYIQMVRKAQQSNHSAG